MCGYFFYFMSKFKAFLREKYFQASISPIYPMMFQRYCSPPHSKVSSVQFSSVAQLCPTVCDSMNHSTPGLPVHHQLPEFTQTHVHQVSDAIKSVMPSSHLILCHPLFLLPPIPPSIRVFFQCVNSSHEVTKVLEFQL